MYTNSAELALPFWIAGAGIIAALIGSQVKLYHTRTDDVEPMFDVVEPVFDVVEPMFDVD